MKSLVMLLLIAVAALAQNTPPPQAAPSNSHITGRVISDDGQPVVKARVSLRKYGVRPYEGLTVTTDAEGNFNATKLSPGLYQVGAYMPAYVTPDEFEAQRFYRPGDFATLTLTKGGVITGRVTDESGEPVLKARVRARRIRLLNGMMEEALAGAERSAQSDDRGVYRIYGLAAGIYQVSSTAGTSQSHRDQLLIYYPSAARAAAAEITVNTGAEIAGIDIRLRKETGFTVSGTLTGVPSTGLAGGTGVGLYSLGPQPRYETGTNVNGNQTTFVIRGVTDGDYELRAATQTYFGEDGGNYTAASTPLRVSVRGASITGLTVRLNPLASLKGRVVLEKADKPAAAEAPKCPTTNGLLIESAVYALPFAKATAASFHNEFAASVPNEQGEFNARSLEPGSYGLRFDWPAPHWYVRLISSLPAKPAAANAGSFAVRSGETLTNVVINVARDGASVQGKVVASNPNIKLPARLRIHLIPAATEQAENLLRYDETLAQADGTFQFEQLAPGKYWLLAQPIPTTEPLERTRRLKVWDATLRMKLRKEAEATNQVVELGVCANINNLKVKY